MNFLRRVHFYHCSRLVRWGSLSPLVAAVYFIACARQEGAVSRRSREPDLRQQNPPGVNNPGVDDASNGNNPLQTNPVSQQPSTPQDSQAGGSKTGPGAAVDQTAPIKYDGFFYPQRMKECHDAGKVYDRGTLDCHPTQILGTTQNGFGCVKSAILKAFGNTPDLEKNIDAKTTVGWKIDQCGIEGGKKMIHFVCFSDKSQKCSENPRCEDPEKLEPKNTKFCVSKINET